MSTIGIVRADFFRLFQDFDRVVRPFLRVEFIGLADEGETSWLAVGMQRVESSHSGEEKSEKLHGNESSQCPMLSSEGEGLLQGDAVE